jgi:nitroreductase
MELKATINKRKSIRSFENKTVPKKILKELIIDATKAPSSSNAQSWRFYIITSKKTRDKIILILHKTLKVFKKNINKMPVHLKNSVTSFYQNLGDCPNIIFIYTTKEGGCRDNNIMSVSAAAENIMLSAVDKGLGTCWIGSFKGVEKDLSKLLNISNDEELVASIIIGYTKKGYVPLKRDKKALNKVMKFL